MNYRPTGTINLNSAGKTSGLGFGDFDPVRIPPCECAPSTSKAPNPSMPIPTFHATACARSPNSFQEYPPVTNSAMRALFPPLSLPIRKRVMPYGSHPHHADVHPGMTAQRTAPRGADFPIPAIENPINRMPKEEIPVPEKPIGPAQTASIGEPDGGSICGTCKTCM